MLISPFMVIASKCFSPTLSTSLQNSFGTHHATFNLSKLQLTDWLKVSDRKECLLSFS